MTKPHTTVGGKRKGRRKISSAFIEENPSEVLESVAAALNLGERADPRLDAPAHARLLRTVRAWKAATNLFSMKLPTSGNRAATSRQFRHYWETMKPLYVPVGRRLRFSLVPAGGKSRDIVAEYFTRLILCSQCEKLGGPCLNPKCGKWYAKPTFRDDSVFCSKKCAGSAVKARGRAKERTEKIKVLQEALDNYQTREPRWRKASLREYLEKREPAIKEFGISKKFITMAINKGEVKPPPTLLPKPQPQLNKRRKYANV